MNKDTVDPRLCKWQHWPAVWHVTRRDRTRNIICAAWIVALGWILATIHFPALQNMARGDDWAVALFTAITVISFTLIAWCKVTMISTICCILTKWFDPAPY